MGADSSLRVSDRAPLSGSSGALVAPLRSQVRREVGLTPWGWLQRPTREELERMVCEIRLLTRSEVLSLFPDCEILTERLHWVLPNPMSR